MSYIYQNNRSTSSLNDNLYDISINQQRIMVNNQQNSKPKSNCPTPKRIASMTSLPTLNEIPNSTVHSTSKRPGDYYIQKINSSKSNLPPQLVIPMSPQYTFNKPRLSGDSTLSFQSSIISDDHSSILSSQFDAPMTTSSAATSATSATSTTSTTSTTQDSSSRLNSLTTNSPFTDSNSTLKNIPQSKPPVTPNNLRSASTTNVHQQVSPSFKSRSKSATAIPTITRSKSKFMSLKEAKERQILRKKKYEENDVDEEILSQDLDNLIFNVPVIKNYNELYSKSSSSQINIPKTRSNSTTSTGSGSSSPGNTSLSRVDLVGSDFDKYHNQIKPCPLPGKLSMVEEAEFNEDSEITKNISQFYQSRSLSTAKLAKVNRSNNMLYKLPNYIKSQSSLDDLHLISVEKLNIIEQSNRPINLPPKSINEKNKHKKEAEILFTNYNSTKRNSTNERVNKQSQIDEFNQQWRDLYSQLSTLDSKIFNKQFNYQKNMIRKLAWDSSVPKKLLFNFMIMMLSKTGNSKDSINTIKNSYELFTIKYEHLSSQVKNNKEIEFDKIISHISSKPIFQNCSRSFIVNFKYLLYIKSISEFGLNKLDEILIPILLSIFPQQSLSDTYTLLELINSEIFNREFISALNRSFAKLSDSEFKDFNVNWLFNLICQFNDCLPLSLSAPSTPIMSQHGFDIENEVEKEVGCSLMIVEKLLTLLIIYSNSIKTKDKNNIKILNNFVNVIFKYYHLNWNDFKQCVNDNISIRLNYSSDDRVNLDSFVDKWKDIYKKN
ncbi:unnamed protein product [Candida verbasci]|uniref:Protein SBE2 n=1 Tax=Candida verbasci TaxID=1227364 RepID=A0A9W4TXA0_9ASCO|nr:unnamed protein product [Candida verbasci]